MLFGVIASFGFENYDDINFEEDTIEVVEFEMESDKEESEIKNQDICSSYRAENNSSNLLLTSYRKETSKILVGYKRVCFIPPDFS